MQEINSTPKEKFSHPLITAKGETRAWVDPVELETLWFNTGTLCNLECVNCYIESSPKNDRLVYLTCAEVIEYLEEIKKLKMKTREIAFTGGEPFLNPEILPILEACLERGFQVLILTNAMQPMLRYKNKILDLKNKYLTQLVFRVSLDHYSEKKHALERGDRAWGPALKGLKWLSENGFNIKIAGRTLWNEGDKEMREGYKSFFERENIKIDSSDHEALVLFPEMDDSDDVPEITTACWDILNKKQEEIMCSNSRMIIKRKGDKKPSVAACTLLPYEDEFVLGESLKEGFSRIMLNHHYCSKFCVLGGGSCSG